MKALASAKGHEMAKRSRQNRKASPVRKTPDADLQGITAQQEYNTPNIQRKKGARGRSSTLGIKTTAEIATHYFQTLPPWGKKYKFYREPPKALIRTPEDRWNKLCLLKTPFSQVITSFSLRSARSSNRKTTLLNSSLV